MLFYLVLLNVLVFKAHQPPCLQFSISFQLRHGFFNHFVTGSFQNLYIQ